jgi:hypothetical protein
MSLRSSLTHETKRIYHDGTNAVGEARLGSRAVSCEPALEDMHILYSRCCFITTC